MAPLLSSTSSTLAFSHRRHRDADVAAGGDAPERGEIAERHKWRVDKIFPDWESWEEAFREVESALPELAGLQGSLGESARQLRTAIERIHDVQRKLEVVGAFASMRSDEDTRAGANTARRGRAGSLAVEFGEAVSWFESEVLALPPPVLQRFLEEDEGLRLYEHFLDDIQRARAHTRSAEVEAVLAAAGNVTRGASDVFSALNNADLRYPTIVDAEGREVELTKARYYKFIKSPDRRVRRDAFEAFLGTYNSVVNTLAANMDANVKNHVFYARARHFPGTLEAALHPSAVPPAVFHMLIDTVNTQIERVHRLTALKQRVLGLDELAEYDLYVPLFPEAEFKFTYEEACDLLLDALAPLGEEYREILRLGYREGWIDVHESRGKRSGAYSGGVYDTQPYILLNWSDELGDTFTLAHELGHSVHTYLARHHQPYVYGDYPIFTAEVASTCNEMLLMDYLLRRTEDPARKLYLLDYYLGQINSTVFRQTMFAEFERDIHRVSEEGETLTADLLGERYVELLRRYWGPAVVLDPQLSPLSWSRIPHFYYNFYVYQYATAYSAAAAFSKTILAGEERDRERYLDVLRSGSSRYPVETVQLGGVDMTTAAPVEDVFTLFDALLDDVEALIEGK
ncbi:MAG: oligoendopeptidase F [Candidatus Krumholzibacteriia bacterium]